MQRLNKEVAAAEKDLAPLQKRLAPLQAKAKALEAQMDNAGGSPLKKQKEAVAGLQQVLSAATLQGASLLRITRLWPPQPDRHPCNARAWSWVAEHPRWSVSSTCLSWAVSATLQGGASPPAVGLWPPQPDRHHAHQPNRL